MSIETREQVPRSRADVSGDTWSQIASHAYERDSRPAGIQLAATACNPKLDAPITPAERVLPLLPQVIITETPVWRMNEGCRQIPRRRGAE